MSFYLPTERTFAVGTPISFQLTSGILASVSFGDGNSHVFGNDGEMFTHSYLSPGTYTVVLSDAVDFETGDGLPGETIILVITGDAPAPVASVSVHDQCLTNRVSRRLDVSAFHDTLVGLRV